MADIPNTQPDSRSTTILDAPDKMVKARDLFGIDSDLEVPAFSEADERVPDLDPAYVFDAIPPMSSMRIRRSRSWRASRTIAA